MAKVWLCSLILILSTMGSLSAQNLTVSGKASDATGEPVIGAYVYVQGTRNGTSTDLDGKYTLSNVPRDAKLVFTFLGFKDLTVNVSGRTLVDVVMEDDALLLEDAVITAEFGIKRAARSIGGTVQHVRGDEISAAGRENFASALQGRVAGLQISNSSGTPGASSSILIRQATSISGNNQPLYVIDGIPMNNSTFDPDGGLANRAGKDPTVYDRDLDFGNRGMDLNSEDIADITVLKGAAAAALYGSDAANGAIIITTKKGSKGRGVVSFSTRLRADQAYRYPELQTKYDLGMYGSTNYYTQRRFGAEYLPGTKLYNNLKDFFDTGFTQNYNLSFETGNDNMTFRANASLTDQTGIVPTSAYNRFNLTLSGTANINSWINIEASMQFTDSYTKIVRKGTNGPLRRAMTWPLTDQMSTYLDDLGEIRYPENYVDEDILNPYFDLYKNLYQTSTNRSISNFAVNITPFKDFVLRAQAGLDYGQTTNEIGIHPHWSSNRSGTGSYDQTRSTDTRPTIQFIATYRKGFGKFDTNFLVGYHQYETSYENLAVHGEDFKVIDFYSIANCDLGTLVNTTKTWKKRLQAISMSAELSYNNLFFLTFRARNDWSSTLPVENNSYFYPSLDATFIVSDLPFMKPISDVLSYLKLRASIAQIGSDAPALSIYPALEAPSVTGGGYRYGYTGPNLALKPEMNTSWEVGFEARLFRDRLTLDASMYKTRSEDQIITGFRMSYATGFVLNNRNIGSFWTQGVEASLLWDIVKTRDITTSIGLTWSKGWSEVTSLPKGVDEIYQSGTWVTGNIRNGKSVGNPITSITGNDFMKNEAGQILIDPSSGTPIASGAWTVLGDLEPKFTFGITPSFRWKNLSVNAVFDGKFGATIVNGTKRYLMQYGFSEESVAMRESGPVVFEGVIRDGNEDSDNPTINNIAVYQGGIQYGYSGLDPNWIETDVHMLRLLEARITYSFDRRWLERATRGFISRASASISGTDLFILTNYSGIDVTGNSNSAAMGGTGGRGIDMLAIAPPRGITFGLNITF